MSALLLALALIALTLAGCLLARPLGDGAALRRLSMLAQGHALGLWLAGALALGFERGGITAYALPLLGLALALAALGARRLLRAEAHGGERFADRAFVVVLAALTLLALLDALGKPVVPWDAWNAWLYRAEAMRAEPGARFQPDEAAALTGSAYGLNAAHYPAVLTATLVWLARATGAALDGPLLALWPIAYAAQALLLLALGRAAIARAPLAALPAWLWMLTPLALAHAALAGYMDLYGGLYLCLALAFARDASRSGRARLALALLMLAQTKVEGLVWAVLLVAGLALAARPRATLRAAAIAGALLAGALLAGALALAGGRIEALDGRLVLALDQLRIPYLGATTLAFRPVLDEAAVALFGSLTFGLSIYALLALLLVRLAALRRPPLPGDPGWRRALAATAWLGLGFVAFLFLFTDASRWAENQTSLSRVILQWLPLWLLAAAASAARALGPAR